MNQNQSSRPFLRLFSALQSTEQLSEPAGKMPVEPVITRPVAGQVPATTTCATHQDTRRQGRPLESEDKMIAGSIGPRSVDCSSATPRRVEVSLADIAPVLADAINHQRGWLSDFSDDTVTIDADLYEVLLAYQQMRRLNAA